MSQGSTEELRARDYVLALLWRAQARAAAALNLQATFVFRPAGVAGGNVYTDWPSLYAAFSRVQGPRWVWVDATLANAVVPAGTYNIDQTTFGTFGPGFPTFTGTTLNWSGGAVAEFTTITLIGNITFAYASASSSPVATMVEGGTIVLDQGSELDGGSGSPWALVPNGITAALFVKSDSQLGEGTHASIGTAGTGHWNVFAWDRAFLSANSIASAGVDGVEVFYDAGTTVGFAFSADITSAFIDQAAFVAYTATTPANWNPVPTSTAEALDQLAAPNTAPLFNAAPLGPSVSVSLSVTVTKHKSGKFLITASMSGTAAGAGSVLIFLQKDAAGIGGITSVETTGGGNNWWGSISWIDTAADDAAHTYAVLANSGSALTVNTNQAIINVIES